MSATAAAGVVMVGALPRILLAAGLLPEWARPFVWSDVLHTWERGLVGGRLPYWDGPFEYPPLIGYASGIFSAIAPSAAVYVALWALVQAAAAAVVAAAIVGAGRRALLAWTLAPQLALLAPINFDVLAVAALVLAVRWERARASARASVAIALGTAAKLFPLVALPVLFIRGLRRDGTRLATMRAALLVVLLVLIYGPSATAPFASVGGLGRYAVGIDANFDSFWGIVAGVIAAIGVDPSVPMLAITLAGLAVTYAAVVLPASLRARDVAVPFGLAVLTLLLWSRLYSPQYSLWLLPFFALLPLPARLLGLLIAADVVVFLSVYPLTLRQWSPDDPVRIGLFALLITGVTLRHAVIMLTWLAVGRLTRGRQVPTPTA